MESTFHVYYKYNIFPKDFFYNIGVLPKIMKVYYKTSYTLRFLLNDISNHKLFAYVNKSAL